MVAEKHPYIYKNECINLYLFIYYYHYYSHRYWALSKLYRIWSAINPPTDIIISLLSHWKLEIYIYIYIYIYINAIPINNLNRLPTTDVNKSTERKWSHSCKADDIPQKLSRTWTTQITLYFTQIHLTKRNLCKIVWSGQQKALVHVKDKTDFMWFNPK